MFVSTLPPDSMQSLQAQQPLQCFLSCFVPEHTDSMLVFVIKIGIKVAGEMALWLRELAALAED